MKVILLQDIRGLGQKMEVKSVADGYARNFLLPKGLAKTASSGALTERETVERKLKTDINCYQEMADKLKNDRLEYTVKTGEKGEVFEPVNKVKIKEALESRGYKDFEINLSQSLKEIKEHKIDIKFPRGVRSKIAVILQPQQS